MINKNIEILIFINDKIMNFDKNDFTIKFDNKFDLIIKKNDEFVIKKNNIIDF